MTREEAKEILAVFRPGTDDESDPVFAGALELMRTDAALKAWFDESVAFDKMMKAELARIIAPPGVRETILAENKIIQPVPWWHRRIGRPQLAAAAAILIGAATVVLWYQQRPTSFLEFRREIADYSWGPSPHVEVKATNMAEVRRILDARNLPSKFLLPPTLSQAEVRGCSLLDWHGHEVPMICFISQGQHLHLVVVDRTLFPDAPSHMPEMDQWQAWRTASWSKDDFSYVLTGLNTPHFVKKFRKSKRWDWEG
jgi:hypothetical protein